MIIINNNYIDLTVAISDSFKGEKNQKVCEIIISQIESYQ